MSSSVFSQNGVKVKIEDLCDINLMARNALPSILSVGNVTLGGESLCPWPHVGATVRRWPQSAPSLLSVPSLPIVMNLGAQYCETHTHVR